MNQLCPVFSYKLKTVYICTRFLTCKKMSYNFYHYFVYCNSSPCSYKTCFLLSVDNFEPKLKQFQELKLEKTPFIVLSLDEQELLSSSHLEQSLRVLELPNPSELTVLSWKPHYYKHFAMPTGSQEMSVKLWSIWNITSLLTLIIKMNLLSASRILTSRWHIHHSDSSKRHCTIMNSSYSMPK